MDQTRGGTMKKLTAIAAAATMAIGGSAGIAQARHGADDPAGHVRHGHGADDAQPHAKKQHHKHHGRQHARHGADDGPNHT
jgi:hypothetical protein